MATNKRYIIQVGDTVRIDRSKVNKYIALKQAINKYTNFHGDGLVESMVDKIDNKVTVKSITLIQNETWIDINEDYFSYPLEVCSKVMK